jgi:hypothetical protein
MSGMPGDGCDDPRTTHPHWCGFCGAERLWSAIECQHLRFTPPCPRCGEKDWRSEVDEMTGPDFREAP